MPHDLSTRECEILELLADGKSNDQAAAELGISRHTVAAHMRSIFAKLDVPSRGAAISWFERNGRPGWKPSEGTPEEPEG